jgi:hypothetical protein
LKNQQATLLLAVILAAPAFALADNIPGHSRSRNTYVAFSEGFSEQQGPQSGSARCNFLLSSMKRNGVETNFFARASFSEFAKSDKDANSGAPPNTGVDLDSDHIKLGDFGGNQGASSDPDKDHGKASGNDNGGDGDNDGKGSGNGTPHPEISVAEPGSQTLLLFGLAGLGMLFYRRKTLTNAI